MKYTKIAEDAFKKVQFNAGLLLRNFNPETGEIDLTDIIGATSGGLKFDAKQTITDLADGIDNAPLGMKELQKHIRWEVNASGTFVTVDANSIKDLLAAADVSDIKITPRNTLKAEDFIDLWIVGDYGDVDGGFIAINLKDGLSVDGFSIQTNNENKGNFPFNFKGHYSITAQDTPPFDVYVKEGTAA